MVQLPKIVFGTSALGNLYKAHSFETKLEIIRECINYIQHPVFDSAGKYGAGLALETLGKCLTQLKTNPNDIIISNKLGWLRTELKTQEPTFEKGVWFDLEHDAIQKISYDGIMECFHQGNELLGGTYKPQMLSVHDPDEYINQGKTDKEKQSRLNDVFEAYNALSDLKKQGKVNVIGIGSKDWSVIKTVTDCIDLDWVMFANSFTIMNHPPELLAFMKKLFNKGITIINSAVFHGGFLTGSNYYDYRLVTEESDKSKFLWRQKFYELCKKYKIAPSAACVNFGLTPPGVDAISLNTSNPQRIKDNVELVQSNVPDDFYIEMMKKGLINKDYPYINI